MQVLIAKFCVPALQCRSAGAALIPAIPSTDMAWTQVRQWQNQPFVIECDHERVSLGLCS